MSKLSQYLIAFTFVIVAWTFVSDQNNNRDYVVINEPVILNELDVDHKTVYRPIQEPVYTEPNIDSAELDCLAKNIYHEARGESLQGKMAVANVTLNRVHSDKFPDTVCKVVHQAVYSTWWWETHKKLVPVRNMCQFSWYCDGKSDRIQLTTSDGRVISPNLNAWNESIEVATQALLGLLQDNTRGAIYYYNPTLANPDWHSSMVHTVYVDSHRFMKP